VTVYITAASSNNEHDNADCDFAIIRCSPTLVSHLFAVKEGFFAAKKTFPQITLWHLGNYDSYFVSHDAAESVLEGYELESGDEPKRVNQEPDQKKFEMMAAGSVITVQDDGFWFEGYPKHTGITITSEFFPWKWLTHCTNCGLLKSEHAKGKCLFSPTKYKAPQ
jgi:hypothetical protein